MLNKNMKHFRELSRCLSRVENREKGFLEALGRLYPKTRGVPVWGFTGPPGAGKSTLVSQLVTTLRKKSLKVAVLAVDPSSPFTGGSLLGDRIRMQKHFSDDGVFIRSLGHRGFHGGLAQATKDLIVCLDAHGFDRILIETVGVGQTELGIMEVADSTVVLLVPEAGDAVQMLKAGLTEIADIFVINKADRPGANDLQKILQSTLQYSLASLAEDESGHHGTRRAMPTNKPRHWEIPVLLAEAEKGNGVEELLTALEAHGQFQKTDAAFQKKKREMRREGFLDLLWETEKKRLEGKWLKDKKFQKDLDAVADGTKNPYLSLRGVKRRSNLDE